MTSTGKVVKNSIWLIIQPLVLNVISLFVIGYIARSLGQVDYGKFTFAFAFISLFMPVINMGLGSLGTREIAEKRGASADFFWKLFVLRVFLASVAIAAVVLTVHILGYPADTRLVVYIAGSTLLFYSVTITFHSAFQGFEMMQYIAYINFISGCILTLLSVVVLFAGYRLIGLSLVYAFGSFLAMIMAIYYIKKIFPTPQYKIDLIFWKNSLTQGFPFFLPGFFGMVSLKIGTILLSKLSGDAAVGVFGAANSLIEKLLIIPDGVCTALFPTLAILYQQSRSEAGELFKRFHVYLFLMGLPMAVGTTLLAKPIITLIYGSGYQASITVLQILIWWLFLLFFNSLMGWSLGAVHQEKKVARVSLISAGLYIVFNLLLIPYFGPIGAAAASVVSVIITVILLYRLIHQHIVSGVYKNSVYLKIVGANIVMGGILMLLRQFNVILSIIAGIVVYAITVVWWKILSQDDLAAFYKEIIKREPKAIRVS